MKNTVQLSQLVDMYSPAAVLAEVQNIFAGWYTDSDFGAVRKVFDDFIRLYSGKYPGYRACNTRYHDEMHVTDSFLAMARLLDGYNSANKKPMPARLAALGLIATLLHDAGFIQRLRDRKGTGAKYTLTHVGRSVSFSDAYLLKNNFSRGDARVAANAIRCTELFVPLKTIGFRSGPEKVIGLMLGSADLLGQMASRCYLERLLLLYGEFRAGRVPGYSSELDLLRKTLGFAKLMDKRLAVTLEDVRRYLRLHFRRKHRMNRDLYRAAMRGQMDFLTTKVLASPKDYRKLLRRAKRKGERGL